MAILKAGPSGAVGSTEVHESAQLLSSALQLARAGQWVYDVARDEFLLNDNMYRIFGTTAAEVGGYRMSAEDYARRFVHPEDRAVVREGIDLALAAPDADFVNELAHRFLYGNGETGYLVVRYGVRKDFSNRTIGLFGVNQDVTATTRIQIELERQAALLEMADDAIIVRDAEDRILFWNRGAEDTYGWSREQALGCQASALYEMGIGLPRARVTAEAQRGGQWEGELRHRHRDGREIPIASRWAAATWRPGQSGVSLEINRDMTRHYSGQDWVKTNLARFGRLPAEHRDPSALCARVLSELAPLVRAQSGAVYLATERDGAWTLDLVASHAIPRHVALAERLEPGEGLVGQCALDQHPLLLTGVPSGYPDTSSAVERDTPANIAVFPALAEGAVRAVIELSSFELFSQIRLELIAGVMRDLGMAVSTLQAHARTAELLKETRLLAAELQAQNERLQEQTGSLYEAKQTLEQNHQSLERSNSELSLKACELDEERARIALKNEELEATQNALAQRARQLAIASHYKSEFLANMSHELRTPLNALVVLSGVLAENRSGNLEPAQLAYLATMRKSAGELLARIGEILELSRIEAGKTEIRAHQTALDALCGHLRETFVPLAQQKGLRFGLRLDDDLPENFCTDQQRLQQILGNLLSNAVKFTEQGDISVHVRWARADERVGRHSLRNARGILAFEVTDTGIGIAEDKQGLIWSAFEQADGSVSRRYGGSGLGLAISREFAELLGGEIHLASTQGQGSCFTLYLPLEIPEQPPEARESRLAGRSGRLDAGPDRESTVFSPLARGSEIPEELSRGRRFLCLGSEGIDASGVVGRIRQICSPVPDILRARRGEEGLALAFEMKPEAIFMDLELDGIGGWETLERLNAHPNLCHIPVVMLAPAEHRLRGLRCGAAHFLASPTDTLQLDGAIRHLERLARDPRREVLLAVANPAACAELIGLLRNAEVVVTPAASASAALTALGNQTFDCMILDLKLPGLTQGQVLERLVTEPLLADLPLVVWGVQSLAGREVGRVNEHQRVRLVLDDRPVPPKVLDETLRFLHLNRRRLPLERLVHPLPQAFIRSGGRALILSRRMRVVYPLMDLLERHGLRVRVAEDADHQALTGHRDAREDLILLDAIGEVRQGLALLRQVCPREGRRWPPIVALVADSVQDNPQPWLESGAAGLLPWPLQEGPLRALLQLWMPD